MGSASLRKHRVAIYRYTAVTDAASGITKSVYVRVPSEDFDGLWWASFGTVFGKEAMPASKPQSEETSFWSFDDYAPVEPTSIIAQGEFVRYRFVPKRVFRVQAVMPRSNFRNNKQAYCTHVDDADVTFDTENNNVTL